MTILFSLYSIRAVYVYMYTRCIALHFMINTQITMYEYIYILYYSK